MVYFLIKRVGGKRMHTISKDKNPTKFSAENKKVTFLRFPFIRWPRNKMKHLEFFKRNLLHIVIFKASVACLFFSMHKQNGKTSKS